MGAQETIARVKGHWGLDDGGGCRVGKVDLLGILADLRNVWRWAWIGFINGLDGTAGKSHQGKAMD